MKTMMKAAVLAAVGFVGVAQGAAAETTQWLREGTDVIRVSEVDGKLYCTRVSYGFEMCHGMVAQGGGVWKGPDMKHPDMPGFMTFAGTVTMNSKLLKIEGCMLGGAMCDAEVWTRQ